MPAPQVGEFLGNFELRRFHEIDGDQPGDVRHAVMLARHIKTAGKLAIEQRQEGDRPRLVGLAPFRDLILHLPHRRVEMPEHRGDRLIEVELDTPVPHFNQRLLPAAAPEQRRLRAQALEIAADRHRLRDHGAVVEHERRHAL